MVRVKGDHMKKIFRTLDEQLDILKSRGLVVIDPEKAKNIQKNTPGK